MPKLTTKEIKAREKAHMDYGVRNSAECSGNCSRARSPAEGNGFHLWGA